MARKLIAAEASWPDECQYGVITVDTSGGGTAIGVRRFVEILQVGQLVVFEGAEWLVESINENIDPPIVVLVEVRVEAAS